jgi:phosphate/sulfate permease
MNKKKIIGLILILIIFTGIIGGGIGYFFSDSLRNPFVEGKVDREKFKEEISKENDTREQTIMLNSSITFINMAFSIILIGLYVNLYRKVKSEFTIGLIIVMIALFVYAITSNPFFHLIFGYRILTGIGPFVIIPHLFTTLAMAVLLYLSLK